jgi:hypothetical protein
MNRLLLRLSSPAMAALLFGATSVAAFGQNLTQTSTTVGKTFIDYFQPTPILSPLSTTVWGAATVGPRDQKNGLEDPTMKLWDYWDGQIIHGPDGKYHIFASRWDQSFGHNAWFRSKAVHAVSDNLLGPYIDKGLCWPDDQEGKGHNVTALVLPRPNGLSITPQISFRRLSFTPFKAGIQPTRAASSTIIVSAPPGVSSSENTTCSTSSGAVLTILI